MKISLQEGKLFVIKKNNTTIYMDLVNSGNQQFSAVKFGNKQGLVCNNQSGGFHGATMDSLSASADSNMGRSYASPVVAKNCQKGGAHDYDADMAHSPSYGFTKSGASLASDFKGSYAPVSKNSPHNQCGGKKRKSKRRRRRKNKSRKSRKRRRTRRRRRKVKHRGGKRKTKHRRRHKKRGGSCSRFRRRRTYNGGSYVQYGSNVANTPSYGFSVPETNVPWALANNSIKRHNLC